TEFDSDGRMTMVGGARKWRVLRPELQQEEIRKVLKPDGVYIGVYYGYSLPVYANDNEELFFKQRIPYRWDGVSNFEILVSETHQDFLNVNETDSPFGAIPE
ncbi:unnamed protein product, partial [marine sediment metagenome]